MLNQIVLLIPYIMCFFLIAFLTYALELKIKKKYMAEHLEEWVGMKDLK